ncbi:MAG: dienelactone hydrolase family protein, partial [Rhodanobacter sp.]
MGQQINIPTSGTQCIGAYVAQATGKPKGGLVVIQEIYGVNAHMRSVVDRFAALGYTAIAPAFFDHLETGVELNYDMVGTNKGKQLVAELGMERAIEDVASAAEA